MTFVSGSKMFYHASGLSFDELCIVLRSRASIRSSQATIHFDCSWLARKLNSNTSSPVPSILTIARQFCHAGIAVVLVLDNRSYRHHSKKASIVRDRKAEQSRIDAIILKQKLMIKIQQSRDTSLTTDIRFTLHKEIDDLDKLVKKKEKDVLDRAQCKSFFEDFNDAALHDMQLFPSLLSILEAVTQADSVIAYETNRNNSDGSLANDGDFIMNCGEKMLLIKDFKFARRGANRDKCSIFDIASSHYSVLKNCIVGCLNKEQNIIVSPKENYNTLETDCAKFRCVVALGTGCDALPSGVKSVGPACVVKKIVEDKLDWEILLQDYANKSNMNIKLLHAYLSCLLHEPGNTVSDNKDIDNDDTLQEKKYVHFKPSEVPLYCEEFACANVHINNDLKLISCKGSKGNEHLFMEEEGFHTCSKCQSMICFNCVADTSLGVDTENNDKYCMECYAEINACGEENGNNNITNMRKTLIEKHNISDANDLNVIEIEELYDQLETSGFFHQLISVKYPLQPSNYQPTVTRKVPFLFTDGGNFIRSPIINDVEVAKIIHIVASFVKYSNMHNKETKRFEQALPDVLINICKGSRLDGGGRLMKRANRHAMDNRAVSLISCSGCIEFTEINHPFIKISGRVRASMKAATYKTMASFTSQDLVCCECECKSGSFEDQRVTCVHVPAVGVLFSHLLMDGLAEHILIEMFTRWNNEMPDLPLNLQSTFVEDVTLLLSLVNPVKYKNILLTTTYEQLPEVLKDLRVGTEQSRMAPLPPPSDADFLPLRTMLRKDPSTKARDIVRAKLEGIPKETTTSPVNNEVEILRVENETVDYESISNMCYLLKEISNENKSLLTSKKDPHKNLIELVGHRVVELRRIENMNHHKTANQLSKERTLLAKNKEKFIEMLDLDTKNRTKWATKRLLKMNEDIPRKKKAKPLTREEEKRKKKNEDRRNKYDNPSSYCAFLKCNGNSLTSNKMISIPVCPKIPIINKESAKDKKKKRWITCYEKKFRREEILSACGLDRNDPRKRLYICDKHQVESKKFSHPMKIEYDNGDKEEFTRRVIVNLPKTTGITELPSNSSRGTSFLRRHIREVELLEEQSKQQDVHGEVARLRLECYRRSIVTEEEHTLLDLNENIASAAGLNLVASGKTKKIFKVQHEPCEKKCYKKKCIVPVVTPTTLSPQNVRVRTGFKDAFTMICYVLVVCDGSLEMMERKTSALTWYEEWFVFFELQYGNTLQSLIGGCALYNIESRKTIAKIFDTKLKMCMDCFRKWPRFLSYDEDVQLRDDKWNQKYRNKRVIFHDNTGIPLTKPTDGMLQRLTWSAYYAGNVAKGGVWIQCCGYLGTLELFPGAISDSEYFNVKSEILKLQQEFQKFDPKRDENGKIIPFLNILDRGYRSTQAAWKAGQFILQPTFSKSDQKFGGADTLKAASVAADRSGNERAVRVSKQAGYLMKKHRSNNDKDTSRLCDMWLCHGFQRNFMNKNVM